jgi:protein translocase SecG subunit
MAISITLITTILLQKRGAGLGGAFGGGGGGTYYQKRGAEKILFYASIVLSVLFVGLGFVILVFF